MLQIANTLSIEDSEFQLTAIRAMGSGGQNVNKVSSAIHLRFDINASSLPALYKARLIALSDNRITKDAVVIIKAQSFRTQEQNKEDALLRLKKLILFVTKETKKRKATRPSLNAKRKRMDSKKKNGATKALRGKIKDG